MTHTAAPAKHVTTLTETRRTLGRVKIVDHHWGCTCGKKSEPPLGFGSRRDAEINAGFHRHHGR